MSTLNPAALAAALRGDIGNALIANAPGGIRRQEAEGQKALVERCMLPKEITGATIEELTSIGFKFGEDIDELFIACELPAGWRKQATDHSMNSDLVDDQGRKRGHLFYKAAFYDRRADLTILRRFNIDEAVSGQVNERRFRIVVRDGDDVIFDAGERRFGDIEESIALRAACEQWLDQHHPEWRNQLAYW